MDWSVWNHLILQVSNRETFVYDSCVAIGALLKAIDISDSMLEAEPSTSTLQLAKMHREFALLKYGKAVKSMQEVLIGAELRLVLIACLLVYAFENLVSNQCRHAALSHGVSGQALLQEWLAKHQPVVPDNRHLHSPVPAIIDDELVEAFSHIDLQITTVFDPRPLETHRAMIRGGLDVVQKMPSTFNDLSEAQGYLMVIMRRCHHFLACTWLSTETQALNRELDLLPHENLIVKTGSNIWSTSYTVSNNLRIEQREYAEDISRWSRAFKSLYERTQRSENIGSRSHLIATLLRIHEITTTIVVAGVLFTEELAYDTFLAEFQEMFDLAIIVVNSFRKKSGHTHKTAGFLLDLGISAPLFLLTNRCRDHTLRANAIEILRGWHPEASWHPRLIAEIGDFLMDVEELGNPDGFIPEKSRAVFTTICEESQRQTKNEAVLQCVQRYGGANGGPVWHERRVLY